MCGIEQLNFVKQQSALVNHQKTIAEYIEKNSPASIKQACYEIEQLTDIRVQETQMRRYLKSIGVRCGKSLCTLLEKIAFENRGPITAIMDNARYQHCKIVMGKARELNIELLFLPSYSPNLNLIERIWNFIKKKCLKSQYHSTFESFKQSISCLLKSMHRQEKDALKTLLTLKFQLFTGKKKPPVKEAFLGSISYLKSNHVTENTQSMW